MINRTLLSCALLSGSVMAPLLADTGVERLEAFLQVTESFSTRFEQTLYDADSEPLQSSRGTLKLMRPGRFIWQYETPAGQMLVADGEQLWMLDNDLEQVTVNPIENAMSGSPFAVFMGTASLDEAFETTALGEAEGIDWLSLKPLADNSDFEEVFIGFDDAGIAAMELRDNFGQATQIRFSDFTTDVDFALDDFDFVPPAGFDVIGLEGSAD